jgi:hypothetical protein
VDEVVRDEKRIGFLSTRDDTVSRDTSAASPAGRRKSIEDRRPGAPRCRLQATVQRQGRMTRRNDGNEGLLNLYLV